YTGTLVLDAPNTPGPLSIPFTFTATSDAKGDLDVEVVDESTYFADGAPKLPGATVTLIDVFSRQPVATGTTGADGRVVLSGVPEGSYDLEVKADKHDPTRSTITIVPGQVNAQTVFLRTQLVTYNWTVQPRDFEDRTKIVIESVFQTNVPAPVVTVDPGLIDLNDVVGNFKQIDLTVTNHGLIQAVDLKFNFPDHPLWSITPLIDTIAVLPAKSEVIVPVIIRRKPQAEVAGDVFSSATAPVLLSGSSGGPCSFSASIDWKVQCGPFGIPYSVPIPVLNANGNCTSPPGSSGPGSGGGGPGGLGGSPGGRGQIGPTSTDPHYTYVPPEQCKCDPDNKASVKISVPDWATSPI